MRAINHALTGAVIGLTVSNPVIAVPAAVASHLVCDVIPHFGLDQKWIKARTFELSLVLDALLCGILVLILFLTQSPQWLLAAVCAFAAAAPDFISIRKFLATKQNKPFTPNALERFLKNIQWFERTIGATVEVAWFVAGVTVLSVFI